MSAKPLILGHRGAACRYPENTLLALEQAVFEYRADGIEFDLHLSSEGVPVVIHDAKLNRTTDGDGYVSRTSLKDLAKLDAGCRFTPDGGRTFPFRSRGLTIPRFEDVLERFPQTLLAVEIKSKDPDLIKTTLQLIKKHGAENRVIVGSKYHSVSQSMERYAPETRRFCSRVDILALRAEMRTAKKPAPTPRVVASVGAEHCGMRFDTREWIEFLHAKKITSYFWTVDDPDQMRKLGALGADGLITNDPALMRRVMGREIAPTDG